VVKGLLLDFYGTVVRDDDEVVDAIAARVAAGASARVTAEQVTAEQVSGAWWRELCALAAGPRFMSLRECTLRSLGTVMSEVDCPGDPAALCAPQLAHWRRPPLRPGTRAFLADVSLPICVVSDADRDDLAAAIAWHGLVFTAVVTSEEVGAYKPDPAMFTQALAALSLDPDEVLHVGDSLRSDIRGAAAAGIRAVWVNPGGRARPADLPVAYEIRDLTGLSSRLAALA
jgi:2-haloacid dehalogenase